MGQPLSMDLRSRLLAAIDEGMSCRAAAARFGVAPSTAIRWQAQWRETGNCTPKPQGGDMRSRRVEERREDILALWEARKDISLEELRAGLVELGLLSWAVERGFLAINAAHGIKLIHKADRSDLVWEAAHWQAFRALDETGEPICPPQLMAALELASMTGLRLGDLVRLDWDHVGEKAIVLTTKKRGGRAAIPIFPDLRAFLDRRQPGGQGNGARRKGPVLTNSRGKGWTESGLGSVFQKSKPEGFDRTMHDLRGTYVTWLAVKGFTDEEIARVIGWTARRVAAIRARYVDEARVVVSMVDRMSA